MQFSSPPAVSYIDALRASHGIFVAEKDCVTSPKDNWKDILLSNNYRGNRRMRNFPTFKTSFLYFDWLRYCHVDCFYGNGT